MLAAGVLAAFAEVTVDEFETHADTYLRTASHPTLGREYLHCSYAPMVELLDYLAAKGFSNYIVSEADVTSCVRSARRSTASPEIASSAAAWP